MPKSKKTKTVTPEMDLDAVLGDLETLEAEAEILSEEEKIAEEILAQATEDAGPAEEAPIEDEATEEAVVIAHVPGVFKDLVANVTVEARDQKHAEIVSEFATRKAYEASLPGLSSKMLPNLEACEKKMATPGTAGIFCAIDIDPGFINRELSVGARFNVYSLQKVNDLVTGLGAGFLQNAINRAVLLSLFNFREAGVDFNGDAALAAVSDKIKVDRVISKHLVRHTVSPNTASTQKSSTMNALEMMGVITSNKLRGKAEVFSLTDTPQTRRLEEVLLKKAA